MAVKEGSASESLAEEVFAGAGSFLFDETNEVEGFEGSPLPLCGIGEVSL